MNSSRKLICKFFKLHNLILCTCYKVCGIHKIKVVLSTRRNLPTPPSPCRITFIVTVTEFHGDSSVGTHTHSQLASHTSHLRPFSRPSATLTQVHSRTYLFSARPGDSDQSQISLSWSIRRQLIQTNHRQHINPTDRIVKRSRGTKKAVDNLRYSTLDLSSIQWNGTGSCFFIQLFLQNFCHYFSHATCILQKYC